MPVITTLVKLRNKGGGGDSPTLTKTKLHFYYEQSMNNKRRKSLREALDHLEKASDLVLDCASEEQMAHDNLPETLQWTEVGDRMEEVATNLQEASDLISESIELVSGSLD